MRKVHRKGCLCIAILLMLNLFCANAFAYEWGDIPDVPKHGTIIYRNMGEAAGLTGTYTITDAGKDGAGISIGLKPYITQIFKNFDAEMANGTKFFKNGRALIEFDVCPKQKDNNLMFCMNDSNGYSQAMVVFSGTGKLYFNTSTSWPNAKTDPDNSVPYNANEWYNIKILYDEYNRRTVYFLNDEYWGEYLISNTKAFNAQVYPDLQIKQMFFNFHADMAIKDGNVVKSDGTAEFLIDNWTYSLPEYEDYDLICNTNEYGNIFEGKDINLEYVIGNGTDKEHNLTFKYDIIGADNVKLTSGEQAVKTSAKSETRINVAAEADKYGFYTAYAYLYEGEELKADLSTRFSSIVKNEVQNPSTGFSAHPMTHGYGTFEETIGVTKKLGGSLLREDYPMYHMYQDDGVTRKSLYQNMIKYPEMAKAEGLEVLPILGPGPDTMGGVAWPPTMETIRTTNVLDMWSEYCKELTLLLGDRTRTIEVYNEWPGVAHNKTKAEPEAYAEMLKAASKAIREANPEMKITGFTCFYTDAEWIDKVLTALGDNPGQYFDAMSLHPYLNYWLDIPYPDKHFIDGMESVMEVLKKHGVEDKPLYATEYGFSTGHVVSGVNHIDEKRKSDFSMRTMLQASKYFDRSYMYTVTKKTLASLAYEGGLGHTSNYYGVDIPYEALPSALSFAAFNKLYNAAEYKWSKVFDFGTEAEEDDIYVYSYSHPDKTDSLALWLVDGEKMVSIDVGQSNVTVYDGYGNERKLNAYNGYLTLKIGEEPVIIKAKNLKEPKLKDTPLFNTELTVNTMIDNSFEFGLEAKNADDYKLTVTGSDNMTFEGTPAFSGNNAVIKVKTGNNRNIPETYNFDDGTAPEYVNVLIERNGKTIFSERVRVLYKDFAETRLSITPYRSGKWQAIYSVRNKNKATPIEGKVTLSDDSGRVISTTEIKPISGGEKKIMHFILPDDLVDGTLTLVADTKFTNGNAIQKTVQTEFSGAVKTNKPPIIDGVISAGEWSVYTSPVMLNTVDAAKNYTAWGGVADSSGEIYLMYDEDNFYIAAKVTDDVHFGADEKGRLWAQDCIQFSFSPGKESSSAITEFALSLSEDGAKIQRYLSAVSKAEDYDINNLGDTKYSVTRLGNITTYEVKVPKSEIFPADYVMADEVSFSLLIADNDGSGRQGWLSYGNGIADASGKNASKFKQVILFK